VSIVTDHQLVTTVSGFEIEIETDLEVGSFSRILSTVVNGTPVHLSRVVVSGTVVYPGPRAGGLRASNREDLPVHGPSAPRRDR
jgi:hypothetical protein